jgi:hypothetical protein
MGYRYQQPLPPPPPAGMTPPRLVASAFGVVPMPESFDVALEGPFNLIAGLYMDVGSYLLIFDTAQPDTGYHVIINDGGQRIVAALKDTGFILIEATNPAGDPIDPLSFNVEVYRI